MKKKKFIRQEEFTAVQFKKDEHPYHRSIQRVTVDGKIPDFESYLCVIPCSNFQTIFDGDWIIVDSMDNAKGVLYNRDIEMYGYKEEDIE